MKEVAKPFVISSLFLYRWVAKRKYFIFMYTYKYIIYKIMYIIYI